MSFWDGDTGRAVLMAEVSAESFNAFVRTPRGPSGCLEMVSFHAPILVGFEENTSVRKPTAGGKVSLFSRISLSLRA